MAAAGSSDEDGTQAASPEDIELIRIVDRTIHVSPVDRKKEKDYTVRNNTDQNLNYLLLPLREFKRNLQAFDENGTQLNYYPNSEVRSMLDRLEAEDADAHKRIQHRFKQADYKLYLQLPPERPLAPGELRTVRLTFEQSETVQFHKLWDRPLLKTIRQDWKRKLFTVPSFAADGQRYPPHSHDEMVIVVGPPGYSTVGQTDLEGGAPADALYENGLDDDTRVVSTRLPPASGKPYNWDMLYDLVPANTSRMLVLAMYWLLATVMGVVALGASSLLDHVGVAAYGRVLSGAVATGTIGLIFALKSEWTDRYRILSVLPVLLHGLAWAIWTLKLPSSP